MNGDAKQIQSIGVIDSSKDDGIILYRTPDKTITIINNIEFCNSSGGTSSVWVYKFIRGFTKTVLLYKQILSDGDVLIDDTERVFPEGAYLMVKSDVEGVNYVISGNEKKQI